MATPLPSPSSYNSSLHQHNTRHFKIYPRMLLLLCVNFFLIHAKQKKAVDAQTAKTFSTLSSWSIQQQHYNNIATAFAAGKGGGKKKKKKSATSAGGRSGGFGRSSAPQAVATPPKQKFDLSTPNGRMSYITSRIQNSDFSSLTNKEPNSICIVDNFLGKEFLSNLRSEAESLLPTMVPSQSTKWDDTTQSVVSYQKHNVLSTQIQGGTQGYAATPRLVEYVVAMTQHLSSKINEIVPEAKLSNTAQTNKLAVCLGEGSKYDKHIDNMGGDDLRKMTCLLYLQSPDMHLTSSSKNKEQKSNADTAQFNEEEDPNNLGGYFRAYDVPTDGQIKNIVPKGDRLLLFWSDSLVHDVSPSYAPNGENDCRWALTIWFLTDSVGNIRVTDSELAQRHFGTG